MIVAVCNPTCSGLTDTCDAGTCKCGSSSACSTAIATRCLSGVCKCGQASQCTAGTTVPSCLYSQGQTPDLSIAFHVLFSTCKVIIFVISQKGEIGVLFDYLYYKLFSLQQMTNIFYF